PLGRRIRNLAFAALAMAAALILVTGYLAWRSRVPVPRIVRQPLEAPSPPIIADKRQVLALLNHGEYKALDDLLAGYQESSEREIGTEANLDAAVDAFGSSNGWIQSRIDQWLTALPHSYLAHLAKAEYYEQTGWRARGRKFATQTSKREFRGMDYFF